MLPEVHHGFTFRARVSSWSGPHSMSRTTGYATKMSLTLSLCGPVKAVFFDKFSDILRRGHGIHGVLLSQGDGPGLGGKTHPPSSPSCRRTKLAIQKVTFGPNSTKGTTVHVRIRLRSSSRPDPMNISSPAQSFRVHTLVGPPTVHPWYHTPVKHPFRACFGLGTGPARLRQPCHPKSKSSRGDP